MASLAASVAPIRWHLEAALRAHWHEPWPVEGWLLDGRAQIVKEGPQRTVYRVDLPELSFFLKRHHLPDRKTWLRECLRAAKARREHDALVQLRRLGVPAPEPLGWGVQTGTFGAGESFLLTRALPDVVPLSQHLLRPAGPLPADRQRLARDLGRFLAQLHAAGVLHRDLHPGNLLLRRDGVRNLLYLVDLDSLRLGQSLDGPRSEANLAMLSGWFVAGATRADRLRFLTAYVQTRAWLDLAADRRGPRELFRIARRIEVETNRYCLGFWEQRDRRCLANNRYYRRLSAPTCVGHAVRTFDPAFVQRLVIDPDAFFQEPGVRLLKDSPSSTVAVVAGEVDGHPARVILKRFRVTRRSDPWVALLRPTPALRSWVLGQGFLERGLPTARPLAVLHRRRRGLVHEGYLVTEKLENVEELDVYVRNLSCLPPDEARRRLRRQLDRVARRRARAARPAAFAPRLEGCQSARDCPGYRSDIGRRCATDPLDQRGAGTPAADEPVVHRPRRRPSPSPARQAAQGKGPGSSQCQLPARRPGFPHRSAALPARLSRVGDSWPGRLERLVAPLAAATELKIARNRRSGRILS